MSNTLVDELLSANELVISSPMYNFGVPSPLKSYFDHVVRAGRTFARNERGYVGLLADRRAYLLTARGGRTAPDSPDDFQTPWIRAILAFIGITEVEHVALEGMALDESTRERSTELAKWQVHRIFAGSE